MIGATSGSSEYLSTGVIVSTRFIVNSSEFTRWLTAPPPRAPLLMGILNVTPDSFSDGGQFNSIDAAVVRAEAMVAGGAHLIDVGGESTRPGADPVAEDEQIRRVRPVIDAIARRIPNVVISIDTTRSAVARAACEAGASLINDISAGRDDVDMLAFVAKQKLPIVLMHMRGTPKTMDLYRTYSDVLADVEAFLAERRAAAECAGIARSQVLLDPGIGFAKTDEQNLKLLKGLRSLASLRSPLVIGASRKGFIGRTTGAVEPASRLMGTAAVTAWCVANGTAILRVHDVDAMAKVIRMIEAIQQSDQQPAPSGPS